MTIAQIYEEAKRQLDKGIITIGEFSEIVDREYQEPSKWIPVSERLPENAFGCLVTVEEDDIYGEPQSVIYPEFVGYDGETWNDASGKQIAFEVIAWMPLPPCYEPQESEDEE